MKSLLIVPDKHWKFKQYGANGTEKQASITLNRYNDIKWNKLPATLIGLPGVFLFRWG